MTGSLNVTKPALAAAATDAPLAGSQCPPGLSCWIRHVRSHCSRIAVRGIHHRSLLWLPVGVAASAPLPGLGSPGEPGPWPMMALMLASSLIVVAPASGAGAGDYGGRGTSP